MSLRWRIGSLIYDWPRYLRLMARGHWMLVRNRDEEIETDGRGVRCEWEWSTDLHLARVYPSAGARLMRAAFRQWPVVLSDAPVTGGPPEVSFIVGHRGASRLPHLLGTLRSMAGQRDAAIECIVVEQAPSSEVRSALPDWVRYLHTPVAPDADYNRAAAFNAGARIARADVLIFHDNDMLVPSRYGAEALARMREGMRFVDLKRFAFYLGVRETEAFFRTGRVVECPEAVRQNMRGGSVVAARDAFLEIGGYDEEFVGWGGEDNEFWERAVAAGGADPFAHLPLIHLDHPPQGGKLQGNEAPAVKRYHDLRSVPPEERIRRLRSR